MSKRRKATPNTHLGEIDWAIDSFFGSKLWICQDALGMFDTPRKGFLDRTQHSIEDLWEYFRESELENGMLGLDLFLGEYWDCWLCTISTTIPYEDGVSDQVFLNLIQDFVDHVWSLPLADWTKREGSLWSDEDIKRGYSEAENSHFMRLLEGPAGFLLAPLVLLGSRSDEGQIIDDVPF